MDKERLSFVVVVEHDRKVYRFPVEALEAKPGTERYLVKGANKELVLVNNRPLLRNKGIKHRRPMWKVEWGQVKLSGFVEMLILAVEAALNKRGIV